MKPYEPLKRLNHGDTRKAMATLIEFEKAHQRNERGYSPALKNLEVLLRELEWHRTNTLNRVED